MKYKSECAKILLKIGTRSYPTRSFNKCCNNIKISIVTLLSAQYLKHYEDSLRKTI